MLRRPSEDPTSARLGVFGIPASDVPQDGFSSYSGNAAIILTDRTGVYELDGTSEIDVYFARKSVDVALDVLNGMFSDGLNASTDIANAGRIKINNARLSGGNFDGGNFSIRSGVIGTSDSGAEKVTHSGALFGPGAQEAGGVFTVDDTTIGGLPVHGVYTGN